MLSLTDTVILSDTNHTLAYVICASHAVAYAPAHLCIRHTRTHTRVYTLGERSSLYGTCCPVAKRNPPRLLLLLLVSHFAPLQIAVVPRENAGAT